MKLEVTEEDVKHALEMLRPHPAPSPPKTLDQTRRVQLYTWNPARYSNLTNNPKKYMESYKKAEEMTKLIEAAYALLSAVLVPDEESSDQPPMKRSRKAHRQVLRSPDDQNVLPRKAAGSMSDCGVQSRYV